MNHDPFENLMLDEYEQDLENNCDKQIPLAPEEQAQEMAMLRNAALNSLKKTKTITIRINEVDLMRIRKIAKKEGLKYQTFITALLHKVAIERANEAY